jgi:hypothetical protein
VRKDINTDNRASNQLVWKKADFRSVKEVFVGQRDNFTASSALYILVMNGDWRDGRCMITLDS